MTDQDGHEWKLHGNKIDKVPLITPQKGVQFHIPKMIPYNATEAHIDDPTIPFEPVLAKLMVNMEKKRISESEGEDGDGVNGEEDLAAVKAWTEDNVTKPITSYIHMMAGIIGGWHYC